MRISGVHVAAGLIMGLFIAGPVTAGQYTGQIPSAHGGDTRLPHGVIGVSLQIGAERIGDPAILYVGMVILGDRPTKREYGMGMKS